MSRIVLATLLAAAAARAETVKPPHPGDTQHVATVTFAPILALLPAASDGSKVTMLELLGEWRAADKVGAALILGYGKQSTSTATGNLPVTTVELGAQARYYLLGYFEHGLFLAAEAMYLGASASEPGVVPKANGFVVGPMLGYKLATNLGFSLDIHGGPAWDLISAKADSTTSSATASASNGSGALVPRLRINVGWSF